MSAYNVTAGAHATPRAVVITPEWPEGRPLRTFAELVPRDGVTLPTTRLWAPAMALVAEVGERRALALTMIVARANIERARTVHAYGMTELAAFHVAQARNVWRMHRLVREL